MLDAGRFGSIGHVLRLRFFLFPGKVLPEIRDTIDTIGARKRLLQAFDIIEIRLDDLRTLRSENLRLLLARITRDCANGETSMRVRQNRPTKTATLCAGRTHDCNDFLIRHVSLLFMIDALSFGYGRYLP